MWLSATSSSRASRWRLAALATLLWLGIGRPSSARVLLATDEALRLAFPGCEVQRGTVFLSSAQLHRATELAGEPVRSALVPVYRARCAGKPAGTAYLDAHTVRTLQETVMVVVDPAGRVARVEVLSFDEPADYLPRGPWYEQFRGHALDPDLRLERGIRPVTGASLTARATTAAVRRTLAVDRAIAEAATPAPTPAPAPAAAPPRATPVGPSKPAAAAASPRPSPPARRPRR